MLKTLIAIAAICSLVAVLALVLFAPGDNTELKVALATAIVGIIGTIAGYAYGSLAREIPIIEAKTKEPI